MPPIPSPAMATNQSTMTGPKTFPIPAVPRRCAMKSVMRMRTAMGTTYCRNAGVATSMPSSAPRTDTAGVITPSP